MFEIGDRVVLMYDFDYVGNGTHGTITESVVPNKFPNLITVAWDDSAMGTSTEDAHHLQYETKEENMTVMTVEDRLRDLLNDVTPAQLAEHLAAVQRDMEVEQRGYERGLVEGIAQGKAKAAEEAPIHGIWLDGKYRTFRVTGLKEAGYARNHDALLQVFELTKGSAKSETPKTYGIRFNNGSGFTSPA